MGMVKEVVTDLKENNFGSPMTTTWQCHHDVVNRQNTAHILASGFSSFKYESYFLVAVTWVINRSE